MPVLSLASNRPRLDHFIWSYKCFPPNPNDLNVDDMYLILINGTEKDFFCFQQGKMVNI